MIVVCAWLGGGNQHAMNRLRTELELTRLAPLENAPPILAFTTVALGGFRGLIANVLWMRALRLQDAGQYFEMVLLADWISKLQPFFGSVWSHQAWNMAYNISREFQDPYERWAWVRSAIELLRDEGLRYNPTDPVLYQELAWIFHDKMGKAWDKAHWYYKEAWAAAMAPLTGDHPDWNRLLDPATPEDRERVHRLREDFRLDPILMEQVDEAYGPLDWRLPDTQAIYWAYVGLQRCGGDRRIILYRAVWQSLLQAFRQGRVINGPDDRPIELAPNLEIADTLDATLLRMMQAEPDHRQYIREVRSEFLVDAVYFFYLNNRLGEAAQWFKKLKRNFPQKIREGEGLDAFAIRHVTESMGRTRARSRAIFEGLLVQFYYYLALGDDDRADGYDHLARQLYAQYRESIRGQEERLALPPFAELKNQVQRHVLTSNPRFTDPLKRRLITRLGLPPEALRPKTPQELPSTPP